MVTLCKFAYHCYRDIELPQITIQHLSDLANLAYKYDCVDAVRSVSSWLSKFDKDAIGFDLLRIAYLLDHAEIFTKTSRRLLLASSGAMMPMREIIDRDHQMSERVFCM